MSTTTASGEGLDPNVKISCDYCLKLVEGELSLKGYVFGTSLFAATSLNGLDAIFFVTLTLSAVVDAKFDIIAVVNASSM